MKLLDRITNNKQLNEMIGEIVTRCSQILSTSIIIKKPAISSKDDAKNRLKLVLMHDRSKLSAGTLEQMRDELVEVISKYCEIDREALDLNLESESNTIALVANIPVIRSKVE